MSSTNNFSTISKKTNNFDIVISYCVIDDLLKAVGYEKHNIGRPSTLSASETITIMLFQSSYEIQTMKALHKLASVYLKNDIKVPSYSNFVKAMNYYSYIASIIIVVLLELNKSVSTRVKFVDSTILPVCKVYRQYSHKVMKSLATKGKSTLGWFYGLKLHIVCDTNGILCAIHFTTGSVHDVTAVDQLLRYITESILVLDAGYVSKDQQCKESNKCNVYLNAVRANMKVIATIWQQILMNQRSRIETLFDVLKERFHLVTSLPRSINGYLAHYIRSILCYMLIG
jgi:Transposase DDE domain